MPHVHPRGVELLCTMCWLREGCLSGLRGWEGAPGQGMGLARVSAREYAWASLCTVMSLAAEKLEVHKTVESWHRVV